MVRRNSLALLLVVGLIPGSDFAAAAQTSPSSQGVTPAQIDAIFAQWNRPDSPGCALSVMQGGRIVYKRGYGMADLSHDAKITPATPFHVASVSKQFAAAAIVLLAQQGKLSLDDEIHKYVPEMQDFGAPITIRQLLQHTSGLRDQWGLLDLAGYRYSLDLITDEDVMNLAVRQKELNYPPGSQYMYSNTGYTLAGQIVKRVTGQSLREFTTNEIFRPLGMTSTHFRDDHAEINRGEALGYEAQKDGSYRLSVTNFDTVGATSLYTTVDDLAKWDENFFTPQVGGAQFTRRMTRTDKLSDGTDNFYAMGLILGEYRGLPVVEHGGADAGYRSNIIRFPQQHFSVACLCNTIVDAADLSRKVADLYLTASFTKPAEAAPSEGKLQKIPQREIAGKAGYYRAQRQGYLMEFVAEDGLLQFIDANDRKPMRTDGKGNFVLPGLGYVVHFEPAEGEARRMIVDRGLLQESWDRFPAFAPAREALQEFVGEYYSEELDSTYRIEEDHAKLVLKRRKHAPAELAPVGQDLFAAATMMKWTVVPIQFLRDSQGRVSGMTLTAASVRNMKFVRVTAH